MKYRLLTKEQLEALHLEFAQFLATQQIDAKEWDSLKKNKPEVAVQELTLFSDLVWDDVLTKCEYIEHISDNYLNLFKCTSDKIDRIYIKLHVDEIDLTTTQGLDWLINHLKDERVEVFSGSKTYNSERNEELFKLIEQGSIITDGKLYQAISQLIA